MAYQYTKKIYIFLIPLYHGTVLVSQFNMANV